MVAFVKENVCHGKRFTREIVVSSPNSSLPPQLFLDISAIGFCETGRAKRLTRRRVLLYSKLPIRMVLN